MFFPTTRVHFKNFILFLTLWAPTILVPTPSTKGGGGVKKDPPQYLNSETCYKPETFRGVRSILQGLKKLQVGITVFGW